jgi:hypothetical protein
LVSKVTLEGLILANGFIMNLDNNKYDPAKNGGAVVVTDGTFLTVLVNPPNPKS